MPITAMLQQMSAVELKYWEDRNAREYFGDERRDYQAGTIAAAVANWSGYCDEAKSPTDYMVFLPEEQIQAIRERQQDLKLQQMRAQIEIEAVKQEAEKKRLEAVNKGSGG